MLWVALQAILEPPDGKPADTHTQQALGWHALAFTPRITLQDEAVLMEVSASLRLFGGLSKLLKKLAKSFWGQAEGCMRCAPGATAALALGRLRTGLPWSDSSRLRPEDLPMEFLNAARPHMAVLERVGCRTWGDLQALPRGGLARRFGQPLLIALDQAFGDQPESHSWLVLPEVFEESLELPALVENANALMFGVNRLLLQLKSWMVARGCGLLGLKLVWLLDPRRDQATRGEWVLRLTEASQDLSHVARLVAEHLARVRLPAPAHTLLLQSLETAPLENRMHSLLPDERREGSSLAQLIERLSARLGPAQVQRWQPEAHHVPERMQNWQAAQGSFSKPLSAQACQPDPLLPSWLLPEPMPLTLHGERPWHEGPLTLLVGPQRLEAAGWLAVDTAANPSETPVMRDYFVARSEYAGLLWIFRQRLAQGSVGGQGGQGQASWYLHGIFA
jgi:protein ImuB